ncbi:hypothetical protein OIU74_005548 [Salix koriyanagi]|uniref:Uncharacterized protein n=1 Tax=Salix koriyanagi TaxID=2511006 RepID=A0A9Q0UPZ5_9ROSI|nr:hypothetical protein OIU74_005548 [Salix koriyanagi]
MEEEIHDLGKVRDTCTKLNEKYFTLSFFLYFRIHLLSMQKYIVNEANRGPFNVFLN